MTQELILDNELQSQKNLLWWLYLFHGASVLFSLGALSWIPLIINYLKRSGTTGTFLYTHHSWQIRSFWWYFIWMLIGVLLALTVVGIPLAWLVFGLAWLWKAYRLIKGFIYLGDNRPMPS